MDNKDRPVYIISVAAELVDMHPQTLRLYERKGLIQPKRSGGKTRLYSERDVEKLREIRRLTQELGVNLAGVEEIMKLRDELWALEQRFREEAERLKQELGEKLEALKTPPALPAPGESKKKDPTPLRTRGLGRTEPHLRQDPPLFRTRCGKAPGNSPPDPRVGR
jgi:MerR family transcriptional regulator/heat shock protein HspR